MGETVSNMRDHGQTGVRHYLRLMMMRHTFHDVLRQAPILEQTGTDFGMIGTQNLFFRLGTRKPALMNPLPDFRLHFRSNYLAQSQLPNVMEQTDCERDLGIKKQVETADNHFSSVRRCQ